MNEYYFNSKKYIFLLIIVCSLFLILVVKTFDYLPNYNEQDDNIVYTGSNVEKVTNKQTKIKTSDKQKDTIEDPERHKSGHIDFFKPSNSNENKYEITEEIIAPKGAMNEDLPEQNNSNNSVNSNDEQALKCILNAKRFKVSEEYLNAVTELRKIPELTTDKELLAISYEEISNIYAENEKYNTALSFAEKANETSPSFAREVLIAKIYYMSGNIEKAITKINNALKRGF